MRLSLVLPAYNEEKILPQTIAEVDDALSRSLGIGEYEIIVINDGSTDATKSVLISLLNRYPALRAGGYPDNRGKGSAIRQGMLAARGKYVVFTDSDLAYGAEIITEITTEAERGGFDIVIGSRRLSEDGYAGYTPLRKLMSKAYFQLLKSAAQFKYSDSQCGIKCFEQRAAKAVFSQCRINGFAFDLEALIISDKMGLNIGEMPVKIINHNESSIRPLRDAFHMLLDAHCIRIKHGAGKQR